MCGRYTRKYSWREVHEFLDLRFPQFEELAASENVAPTQIEPVCVFDGERRLLPMKWGLVPRWSKDGRGFINARAESAWTKPAFREAWERRRCLVPASGFYEWQTVGRKKQPYLFWLKSDAIMCFGGLWERGRAGDCATFTILTVAANELVSPMHDRMPAILRPEEFDGWLGGAAPRPEMLRPYPGDEMRREAVSSAVLRGSDREPSEDEPPSLFG